MNTAGIATPSSKIEALANRLKAMSVNDTIVKFDRSEFEDSAMVYTFSLTVTNFLGMSATSNFTVRIVNDLLPVVSIAGPPEVSASVENRVTFEALVKLPVCTRQDSNLEFQWQIFVESTPQSMIPLPSLVLTKRKLSLPPGALTPGKLYTVQVTSCIGKCSMLQQNSVAKVSLSVVHTAPRAIIAGGRIRTVGQDTTVELDGSRSLDPESAAASGQQGLVYTWGCDAVPSDGNESLSCSSIVSSNNRPKLSIPASSLRVGSQYTVSLGVKRQGCDLGNSLGCRSEKTFVTVNVVKTPTLNVQVFANASRLRGSLEWNDALRMQINGMNGQDPRWLDPSRTIRLQAAVTGTQPTAFPPLESIHH